MLAAMPVFGGRVGLVHGRMKSADKDRAMADFAGDGSDLLVATTVIEVGIDVPPATIMVVEHAERFGLAQLHQLRGRIGRGSEASTCLLLYQARSARSPASASRSCARPRTGSASPRRICGCAAAARCSAPGRAACRRCASPISPRTRTDRGRARRCARSCWSATRPSTARAGRRCARCSICSSATRRCSICAPADLQAKAHLSRRPRPCIRLWREDGLRSLYHAFPLGERSPVATRCRFCSGLAARHCRAC